VGISLNESSTLPRKKQFVAIGKPVGIAQYYTQTMVAVHCQVGGWQDTLTSVRVFWTEAFGWHNKNVFLDQKKPRFIISICSHLAEY
jgi:hypothetical protein